ncbi:MAG: YdcF family protein [Oscillospiraceae bacterium]|nr:YdcF family protein [Oscillospiraceae bacterium]
MRARKIFNNIILVIGILCILYYLAMGFAVRFGQSLLWLWPLMGVLFTVHWAVVNRSIKTGKPVPLPKWAITVCLILIVIALLLFAVVQGFIASAASGKPPADLDCIIVLGAKVNGTQPSGALSQRIHAAYGYLSENPDTVCIATGGQGEDEGISEAECIRRGLTALGIPDSRIILEEAATDTASNFTNSFSLLPDGASDIGVVTNDFHVLRALWTARELSDLNFYGISARSTPWGYVHYCLREFCALAVGVITGEFHF